jgi:hypothetical protein
MPASIFPTNEKETRLKTPLRLLLALTICLAAERSFADTLLVNTDSPDGRMAAASRPSSGTQIEIEAADDFNLQCGATATSATFVGLLPSSESSPTRVVVEIYRVFPQDSLNPPSGNVLTRANSPSDVAFDSRDSAASGLTFTTTLLNSSFTAANSVVNGINKQPNQTTGGEGAVSGREVEFDVTFSTPINLPAGHYFFVPQVLEDIGNFLWLSSPNPIVSGTPFSPDLQTWIRNANLAPDWSRIGSDIVGGTTPPKFNGSFTLTGALAGVVITPSVASPLVVVPGTPIAPVTFMISGGTGPFTFGFSSGSVPGLSLDPSTGVLSGTPTQLGDFPITIGVTDAFGCNQEINFLVQDEIHAGIPTLGAAGISLLLAALAGAGVLALRR